MAADALNWLRYDRRCYVLALEGGPWENVPHRPDVMGVGPGRRCIEIEIKRSLQDFKQDAEKAIWQHRDLFKKAWPEQFYYFVPPTLVEKVQPFLPSGLGLITWQEGKFTLGGTRAITVIRPARKQPDAKKLTPHQFFLMVRHQSSTLVNFATRAAELGVEIGAVGVTRTYEYNDHGAYI